MEWMILPLKRYAEFGGRSRRKEYWMFFLFTLIASFVLGLVDSALGTVMGADADAGGTGVLSAIFSLAILIPSIAVGVRRLHDTDRSGWWILMPVGLGLAGLVLTIALLGGNAIDGSVQGVFGALGLALIPAFVGGLVLLIFYLLDGTRGPNRFGPDPKDPAGTADLSEVFR